MIYSSKFRKYSLDSLKIKRIKGNEIKYGKVFGFAGRDCSGYHDLNNSVTRGRGVKLRNSYFRN